MTEGEDISNSRRALLAATGGLAALSGWTGDVQSQQNNECETGADVPSEIIEQPGPIEVVWQRLQRDKYTTYVEAKLRNNRSSDYMTATCTVNFYDNSGTKITDGTKTNMPFESRDVWLFKVPLESQAEVGRYELEITAV